mmetsp:Transcript_64762/g.208562  ORF Transcript_64762/g.208562 Transcript_64762/m.208562 type:complete len:257 (-) Transcript_64762:310-1080(-)
MHRRKESGRREHERHEGADQQLHPGADGDRQRLGVRWFAEDVTMHQLPACFLSSVLRRHVIVLCDVTVQRAQQDHGHHAREEEYNHQGVDDGEPVDLTLMHPEVGVPPGGPSNRARRPRHIVRVSDAVVLCQVKVRGQIVRIFACSFCATLSLPRFLLEALRVHLEADNAEALELVRIGVVLQPDADVVVDVVPAIQLHTNREAIGVRVAVVPPSVVAHRNGQVVNEPVHLVLEVDHVPELVLLLVAELPLTEVGT